MEAFLAQVAAAAKKASDQGYSTQGRPPVQRKSAAAGRPLKRGAVRQRSSSARALTEARNGNGGPNSHKHKALNPYGWTEQGHSGGEQAVGAGHPPAAVPLKLRKQERLLLDRLDGVEERFGLALVLVHGHRRARS